MMNLHFKFWKSWSKNFGPVKIIVIFFLGLNSATRRKNSGLIQQFQEMPSAQSKEWWFYQAGSPLTVSIGFLKIGCRFWKGYPIEFASTRWRSTRKIAFYFRILKNLIALYVLLPRYLLGRHNLANEAFTQAKALQTKPQWDLYYSLGKFKIPVTWANESRKSPWRTIEEIHISE